MHLYLHQIDEDIRFKKFCDIFPHYAWEPVPAERKCVLSENHVLKVFSLSIVRLRKSFKQSIELKEKLKEKYVQMNTWSLDFGRPK